MGRLGIWVPSCGFLCNCFASSWSSLFSKVSLTGPYQIELQKEILLKSRKKKCISKSKTNHCRYVCRSGEGCFRRDLKNLTWQVIICLLHVCTTTEILPRTSWALWPPSPWFLDKGGKERIWEVWLGEAKRTQDSPTRQWVTMHALQDAV